MQSTIADFKATIDQAEAQLSKVSDLAGQQRRSPGKWSRKEILGHLIDSAANNHQRFVRAQLGVELVFPGYEQEAWVSVQHYQNESWTELVALRQSYNRHLLHLMAQVPNDRLGRSCMIGGNDPVTLEFLIKDYLVHLKHHLRQILEP